MTAILPYFYPTSVVLVDDSPDLLQNLVLGLQLEKMPHRAFYDPRAALAFLNQETYRKTFVNKVARSEEEMEGDSLTFNPRTLVSELNAPDRFHQISVLVIDYEMPGMRGLELCEQLNNPHIKKILLTGVADESIAIDAFNRGIIDRYIRKHDVHFLTHLKEAITKAQHQYFQELLSVPLQTLAQRPESTALTDSVFISFFKELVKKHALQEYYLVEGIGSFLMVGADKKQYSLITLNDGHIEAYLESNLVDTMTPGQLRALETKEKIPCYYNPFKAPYLEPETLSGFFQAPTHLKGAEHNFYTVFGEGFIQVDSQDATFWHEIRQRNVVWGN